MTASTTARIRANVHAAVAATALIIVAGSLGCGSARKAQAPRTATAGAEAPAAAPAGPFDREKDDIAAYYMQIRSWRVELGMSTEPSGSTVQQSVQSSVKSLRVCPDEPEVTTNQCRDACNIKEAICDNADKICRITEDLNGDAWAVEKCNSGKASCQEATAKCCECAAREPDGAATRQPCGN